MDHTQLATRCRDYFKNSVLPHAWFKPWSKSLQHLGLSYEGGEAVHADLSPRPTRYVSELKEAWEQDLFLEMVERDLWTFFGTLELCLNAKLVLLAGTVTGRFYANEFLQRFAPHHGYSLDGAFKRLDQPRSGKTAFHVLSGGHRKLTVFFCSCSPSARDPSLLPLRIKQNAAHLTI